MSSKIAPFRPWFLGSYATFCVLWFGSEGVVTNKDVIIRLVVVGLAIWCIGRPIRDMRLLFFEWIPFIGALMVYDSARAGALALGRPLVVTTQIHADKFLFLGSVPTIVLQRHFMHVQLHWWDVAASLVYVTHFFGVFIVAGWLWSRDRAAWSVFATRFFLLCFSAAITFALFPTAPPWAAAQMGDLAPVIRGATRGWGAIHMTQPEVIIDNGRSMANPYAAIPSLHAGWALLVILTLWPFVKRVWRPLLVAYPIAMALTLIYTGEHYAIDIFIGWLYVWGVIVVERKTRPARLRLADRLFRRAARAPAIIDLNVEHLADENAASEQRRLT